MPAGKLVACEPDAPLGFIGTQGVVLFLERGAPGGQHIRRPVFLGAEIDEFGNLPIPPFTA